MSTATTTQAMRASDIEECGVGTRNYSIVPVVQLQISGERIPGPTSPPGSTQELFQKTEGRVARGAAMSPASNHLSDVISYLREAFPKPRCLSGGIATWAPSSPPSK